MQKPPLDYVTESFPDRPDFDTGVSHALLQLAAAGRKPPTLRLHRPGRIVAFGRQDAASPGYPEAVKAAQAAGFAAIERLAGGRAAVFHPETVALAWTLPDHYPPARTTQRFETAAELCVGALRDLGVDAHTGEVPGEYCPGGYSVNARRTTKIVGLGQRLVVGAAHVGGVIVVSDSGLVCRGLVPVYERLGLVFDPATAGSIADEIGAVGFERARQALLARFAASYELVETSLDAETLELADKLSLRHRCAAGAGKAARA